MKERRLCIRCVLVAGVVGALVLAAWLPPLSRAAPLPPRPTPRPTRTPTPAPGPTAAPRPRLGAHLVLYVQNALAGLWTIVQWQDGFGDWHDVQGWQGTLDDGYQKRWWVAEKDFATGPFRWALYQGQGGALLDVSASFYLPDRAGIVVEVEVALES
jgi:hypothetical protein